MKILIITSIIAIAGISTWFFVFKQQEEEIIAEPGVITTPFGTPINDPTRPSLNQNEFTSAPTKNPTQVVNQMVNETPFINQEDEEINIIEEKRIVKLFNGITIGHRSDTEFSELSVYITEGGEGNRHIISIFPFSINQVASGEFIRAKDSYMFASNKTLILYEDKNDESLIHSAFVDTIITEDSEKTIFFEDDIKVSTNDKNEALIVKAKEKGSDFFFIDVSDSKRNLKIFSSDISLWTPYLGNNSFGIFSTPITEKTRNYTYTLSLDGEENIAKIGDGYPFNSIISSEGQYLLTYKRKDNKSDSNLFLENLEREEILTIGKTITEKCHGRGILLICAIPIEINSFTSTGHETSFPESWYLGDLSFSDKIIIYNTQTLQSNVLFDPTNEKDIKESNNNTFDVTKPNISADGEYFIFINKKDLSLWSIKI